MTPDMWGEFVTGMMIGVIHAENEDQQDNN